MLQALISELKKTKTTSLVMGNALVEVSNTNKSLLAPISNGSHMTLDRSAVLNVVNERQKEIASGAGDVNLNEIKWSVVTRMGRQSLPTHQIN